MFILGICMTQTLNGSQQLDTVKFDLLTFNVKSASQKNLIVLSRQAKHLA